MTENNESKNSEEIDFVSSSTMQKVIKKSKRKQTLKYILIAFLTSAFLLIALFSGSQYILNKRLEDQQSSLRNMVQGANISGENTYFIHNLFSVLAETTKYKEIGDRQIVWDKTTKEIPLIGKGKNIRQGSGFVQVNEMNEEAGRSVRFNDFNNERRIDFYYPDLSYNFLPNELEIAVDLDSNKLIEIALSFKEPKTLNELNKELGHKNVNWLWVDTTTEEQRNKMSKDLEADSLKIKDGGNAFGFSVREDSPYSMENGEGYLSTMERMSKSNSSIQKALKGIKESTQHVNGELLVSGAVVTGTAEELKRFKNLNFIRASVLGVTIDKY